MFKTLLLESFGANVAKPESQTAPNSLNIIVHSCKSLVTLTDWEQPDWEQRVTVPTH